MAASAELQRLVDTFDRNRDTYRAGGIGETEARVQFIDPLFELLGWDMRNTRGYAESFKDVVHEDAVKIDGFTKAPDYCFRVGGQRVFFLEAKKPSVNLKDDTVPAFQLRRYAWSAKLPLSILTDFEELAVYDCRRKPDKQDAAAVARLTYLHYQDYAAHWDEISAVFSKEAVLQGSFHKYAEATKGKKGTTEVDAAFLEEISNWRDVLARTIALRNPSLSQFELNFAVQKTIDRIVFLRMCEDRGIEPYGQLLALTNGAQIYPRLLELFVKADQRYNSGLFHFHKEKDVSEAPDDLTPRLVLDDKPLKDIFQNLYYPDCPYQFSVLPIQILGDVYEQFLGKVIRLTAGHQAKIEEKPEVKKAGGVKYTPAFVTANIVKNTVGALIDKIVADCGNAIKDAGKLFTAVLAAVAALKICDPACGSGSFLIAVYQYLLDWYLQWYVQHEALALKMKPAPIYQTSRGEWRLTTAEKKRILLNTVFGVDIDGQAVEVTKLSLLLKVLEGENQDTLARQLSLFHERALPDLSSNIKCGNSLIGPEFYEHQQMTLLHDDERRRINVFDWQSAFPQVFGVARASRPCEPITAKMAVPQAGFDVILGNPPYVRQETLGATKEYFAQHYAVYHGMADLYAYFIERAVMLLRDGGVMSYIVANKWMRASYGAPLRRFLKQHCIEEITDFGDLPVFKGVTTYPCIMRVARRQPGEAFNATQVATLDFTDLNAYVAEHRYAVNIAGLDDAGWSLANADTQRLLDKLRAKGMPLGEYVKGKIYRGVLTGLNEAFVIDAATRARLIAEDPKSAEIIKPFLAGRDIKRYQQPRADKFLIFMPKGWTNEHAIAQKDKWAWLIKTYPAIAGHLEPFKTKGEARCDKGDYWWELRACDYYDEFGKPKIIVPAIVKNASYAYDAHGIYSNDKTTIVQSQDRYVMGLLNSALVDFFIHAIASTKQGGFFEYKPMYLSQLPVRTINFSDATDKKRHGQITDYVVTMLALQQKRAAARTPDERTQLANQIAATDRLIDKLVYELYDLSAAEIRIVENKTHPR